MKLLLLITGLVIIILTFLLCLIDSTYMAAGTVPHVWDFFLIGLAAFMASFLPIP